MNTLRAPNSTEEFSQYYHLRWKILRQPWQQPEGSEQDQQEQSALHRMIVDEDNKVLAVGRLEKVTEQQGQIRYMAVDDNMQGQGLGQQIIRALEQQASMLGITEIVLNAREQALGFYEKLGYKMRGYSHTLFGDVKHYSMTKKIPVHAQDQLSKSQALQAIWHDTIPLSKAMNLQISYFDSLKLITRCDTDFNQNLHHTMFAGSIYTLATLTGWGWVYLTLHEQQDKGVALDGDIVLADANIRYHSPIKSLAYGQVVQADVSGNFDNLLQGKNARIKLTAHVYCGENIAATFNGSYFILPRE
ncbi:bifunctional GNAT family N-acetyltransferase/hotdog fold thioesterase [Colwellia sp. MSW7]|uniref:Bifunctional GNAT family N-acetyltransferase/hotdog fold thioesterase n=1 Tax=Colwellia maritima TaxID=2912588 RepID=A0ABS9X656_9GAMM|nr:YiiD C-terminal domain-containing protein [Colwellia maritima]MCI2285728.1 bifunctional GNAT family N-acetyltransferase/hotdog fold thioesterase [Colwellia maritima]